MEAKESLEKKKEEEKGKKYDVTFVLLEQAIGNRVYFDSVKERIIIVFESESQAIKFLPDDPTQAVPYVFRIHGQRGGVPFLDKYGKSVSAFGQREGKKIVLTHQGRGQKYVPFTRVPGIETLEIIREEGDGNILVRIPIKDIKDLKE